MTRAAAVFVISLLTLFGAGLSAQERGIELQGGIGYLRDSGEGPSLPAVSAGVVGWIARSWGFGVRLSKGLGVDRLEPPIDAGDRTAPGRGDLRMWAVTSQWRGFARGTEVNVGVGAGAHGYQQEDIITGATRGSRSGSGLIALDLLVGRRVAGPLHVKGGFTYGWAGDQHPFQPVLIFAFAP
jgi:hypothetical protein